MDENFTIPPQVLSDLCSRFIINVPEEERTDLIRIFFQIEIAHWFYLDFYCDSQFLSSSSSSAANLTSQTSKSLTPTPNGNLFNTDNSDESNDNIIQQQQTQLLKPCSIRTFAENIFRHCPFLIPHANQVDDILSKWKVFKHAVPTNGAIVLDETMRYVLLVQGFWAKASWGFPKGKVVEEETEAKCAIREVLEETGFDISKQLNDDHYLEISINDQTIRLYIITNVSKTTKFEPRTRREIKEVRWFAIDELPVHRKDTRTKQTLGYSPNSFFMVIPFLKSLKQWISNHNMNNNIQSNINNSTGKINIGQRSHSTINHQRHNSHTSYHNNNNSNSSHNNNNHHHHHSQHHSKNSENFNEVNSARKANGLSHHSKQLSKSNDSISSLQNNSNNSNNNHNSSSNQKNRAANFNKSNNTFLRQHSTSFKNDADDTNKQRQFNKPQQSSHQKVQTPNGESLNNGYSNFKDAALSNKTNKLNNSSLNANQQQSQQQIKPLNTFNQQLGSNSKFKPINNENNNNSYNKKMVSNVSVSSGLSNGLSNTNNSATKKQLQPNKETPMKGSATFFYGSNGSNYYQTNNSQHIQNINKVKKHLEFNGPECWINFKFDYDSIVQSLPPLLEL